MITEQDYDSEGNNIVSCPICGDVHCKSKYGGKCPEQDEFVAAMTKTTETMEERFKREVGPSSKAIDYFYSPKILDFIRAENERARQEGERTGREKAVAMMDSLATTEDLPFGTFRGIVRRPEAWPELLKTLTNPNH